VNFPVATTIAYNAAKFGSGIAIRGGSIVADGALTLDHNGSTINGSKGGGMNVGGNSTVTCNALLTVTNNTAYRTTAGGHGGGICFAEDNTTPPTLNLYGGANISNNHGYYGGGIYRLRGLLIVGKNNDNKNIVFDNNTAAFGGAFYQNSGLAKDTIYGNVTMSNNTSTDYGGGMNFRAGVFHCTGDMTITGNTAATYGGGLNKTNGTLTIDGKLTVSNNTATYGGGICLGETDTANSLTLNGASIIGNQATTGVGGGVYMNNGVLNFNTTASTIGGSWTNRNTAVDGAGMYINGGVVNFNVAPTITNNVASNDGGGIYNKGTINSYANLPLDTNTANKRGGGMYNTGTIIIGTVGTNANLICRADTTKIERGGGIFNSGTITCNGNIYARGNSANNSLGGGMANAGILTCNHLILDSNYASKSGGGMQCSDGSTGANILCKGNFYDTNNVSGGDGGGFCLYSHAMTVNGISVIKNNSAQTGAGMSLTTSSTLTCKGFVNILKNRSTTYGGGIYVQDKAKIYFEAGANVNYNAANNGGGIYIAPTGTGSRIITVGTSSSPANLCVNYDTSGVNGGGMFNGDSIYCYGNL
ncbi:MAG: hypothetical protein J5606_09185, partial [Bacteroidales bacterium]|nr:hypothetical protein [Bacteroidales bacterium]